MNLKVNTGLGLAVNLVRYALISVYKGNSFLRPVKTSRYSLKTALKMESLRRGERQLLNK